MAVVETKPELVEVTVDITNEDTGETRTENLRILGGPTPVPELKTELGVDDTAVLWVVEKDGKTKPLADHENFNVKAGDHFIAIVKGGVS
jgi:hypothetical protein